MRWRLLLFVVGRRKSALVLAGVIVVTGLAVAVLTVEATSRKATLTVHVPDGAYASAIVVDSQCCLVAEAALDPAAHFATATLAPGDYVVRVVPNGTGQFLHWYFFPTPVHLQRDQEITVRGGIGRS